MRWLMKGFLAAGVLALFVVVAGSGCSKEIGDGCQVSSDCDPDGERICLDPGTEGGYCTIQGCDYSTCPDEAACIRFFSGEFANKVCATQSDCSLDELCNLTGHCVPRSAESRFCMKTCDSDGDCRDGYECRDLELMKEHGGEPVLAPGVPVDDNAPKFCALAPPSL
jgi:hypothetical protein